MDTEKCHSKCFFNRKTTCNELSCLVIRHLFFAYRTILYIYAKVCTEVSQTVIRRFRTAFTFSELVGLDVTTRSTQFSERGKTSELQAASMYKY